MSESRQSEVVKPVVTTKPPKKVQTFQHFPSSTLAPVNFVTSSINKKLNSGLKNHVVPYEMLSKEYLEAAGLLQHVQHMQQVPSTTPSPPPSPIHYSTKVPQQSTTPGVRRAPPTPFYLLKPTPGPSRAPQLIQTSAPTAKHEERHVEVQREQQQQYIVYEKQPVQKPHKPNLTAVPTQNKKRSTTNPSTIPIAHLEERNPQQHSSQHQQQYNKETHSQQQNNYIEPSKKPIQVISYVPEPGSNDILVQPGENGGDKPYIYIVSTYPEPKA